MKMKLKDIYKEQFEEGLEPCEVIGEDEKFCEPYGSGKYCTTYLIVVEIDGKDLGYVLGLHEEEGWIDGDNGTWDSPISWDSEFELKPVKEVSKPSYEFINED